MGDIVMYVGTVLYIYYYILGTAADSTVTNRDVCIHDSENIIRQVLNLTP